MSLPDDERLRSVRAYHERTKHHPDRFAPALGYLDWANQPDPFRSFTPAAGIELPRPAVRPHPTYDGLFRECPASAGLDADFLGRLFLHSLALSAWKQAPGTRPWSLRINPSSGNLHPTEGYLVTGPVAGLIDRPGVFHYAPFRHRLERRCELSPSQWLRLTTGLPAPAVLIGLTSIHWREAWKYGERAFRYCQHDVGHAIGALVVAARALGWDATLSPAPGADLDRLLGCHLQHGAEAEQADCLLLLYPGGRQTAPDPIPGETLRACARGLEFTGAANRLSREHHPWPVIDQVAAATRGGSTTTPAARQHDRGGDRPPPCQVPSRDHPAERIIRQRRSAVAMDATTTLDRPTFYHMLARTLPTGFPFAALPWPPRVSLALFVHRVDGLEPGLYLLVRSRSHLPGLRASLAGDFSWERAQGCPDGLDLYCLLGTDTRSAAREISCGQDIAADGVFALAMLADYAAALAADGAAGYPRLFWETGLIGQVLYLEAEAAALRATGIGCFFDDLMHQLLGIGDRRWQSLYHFTVGGPLEDSRLQTVAPYRHLERPGAA